MKNTEFAVGSKIRIIDARSCYFRYRGRITGEVLNSLNEHSGWICVLSRNADGFDCNETTEFSDSQICNIQKKFIDIEHIREKDIAVGKDTEGNDIIRTGNTGAFEPGDIIVIQEKHDGSNASISFNKEDNKLEIFSRTNLLDGIDGLRGFKQYIETHVIESEFKNLSNFVIFGEWCVSHKCHYNENWENHWRVYDIWDKNIKNYCNQKFVKDFCQVHNLEYVGNLYIGKFIDWEHCKSFMNLNRNGPQQEGIVVKNQSKLNDNSIHAPKYLKIVNDSFKETIHKKDKKEINLVDKKEIDHAKSLMESIVTENRVNKIILKLIDENIIPKELNNLCIGIIMKYAPKMVWDDILHEEIEIVKAVGSYASKFCSIITANLVRKIILGK